MLISTRRILGYTELKQADGLFWTSMRDGLLCIDTYDIGFALTVGLCQLKRRLVLLILD